MEIIMLAYNKLGLAVVKYIKLSTICLESVAFTARPS